jgi:phosphodiesterase/alkaline phosphatase D-like protein
MDDNLRISRNLQLGTLVDLTMLDTRHYDCSTTNLYYTSRAPESTVELSLTQIEVTAATATSPSPVSNVKGVAFGRFFQVWLEDTVRSLTRLAQP